MPVVSWTQAEGAIVAALAAAGANRGMAEATARSLVKAEAQGQGGHGLSRVAQYASLLKVGRADGQAVPQVIAERDGAVLVDAKDGLAYPAVALAVEEAARRAGLHGVACVAIGNSHHSGVAGFPVAELAVRGLVGLMVTNSPAAMPVPGGRRALLGTNPIAAAFPRAGADPLVIDLALSATARGKIMVAARDGKPIPEGWALDADGKHTTDAKAALGGVMLAMGGERGLALALVVELLAVALAPAQFGFEADSFFQVEGNRPRLGQTLIAIDPGAFAGRDHFASRIEALIEAMTADPAIRLPGARRFALEARARAEGIRVDDAVWDQIQVLAG